MRKWIQNRSFLSSLLLGGLASLVFVGLLWHSSMMYFLGQNDHAVQAQRTVDAVALQVLEMRRAEKDFLLRELNNPEFHDKGASRYLERHQALVRSIQQQLVSLAGLSGGGAGDVIERIRVLVNAYDANFQKLVAAYRERGFKNWGVEGDWRKIVHAVEKDFQDARNAPLLVGLLQLRRDEKDYLLRGESKYIEAVYADLKELALKVQIAGVPNSARIVDGLKQYESLFTKYLAVQERIGETPEDGLQGELRHAAHAVEPALEEISKQAAVASERSRRQLTTISTAIFVIGLALAGSFFFFFFARAIARPVQELSTAAQRVGSGNLNTRMNFEAGNELGILARGFNQMVEALAGLVALVQRSTLQVSSSVNEIAATAKEQQATATQTAATTSEIGTTSKEIAATAKKLVKTMGEVAAVAEQAATLASGGQSGLAQMEATMRQLMEAAGAINAKLGVLNEKASNINQVVTTITKVADQTNLLSLNAAIEAEKAGEYGRGFSVVATEIRRLADQTAVATYDIEQMVREIQSAVSAGVMGMDKFSEEVRRGMHEVQQVGGQLSQVIAHVQTLAPRFESVNESMQAQAASAEGINDALTQLSHASRQTVDALRQSSVAVDDLNQVAIGLRSGVSRFRLEAA